MGRDAAVMLEVEMRQFDTKAEKVQKYVESLVSGEFMIVHKDISLSL